MGDGNVESINNVQFLKTDPKARYQGYTFYFREGFCWNNVLNPRARLLKVKLKQASVNDVGSMSLMPILKFVSSKYIIALLNSNLIFDYYREFVNCTVNVQINDLRQIPIIIPNNQMLNKINELIDKAIAIKKSARQSDETDSFDKSIAYIELEIDKIVEQLYLI